MHCLVDSMGTGWIGGWMFEQFIMFYTKLSGTGWKEPKQGSSWRAGDAAQNLLFLLLLPSFRPTLDFVPSALKLQWISTVPVDGVLAWG